MSVCLLAYLPAWLFFCHCVFLTLLFRCLPVCLCICLFYLSFSLSLTLILTHSHSHSHSLTLSLTLTLTVSHSHSPSCFLFYPLSMPVALALPLSPLSHSNSSCVNQSEHCWPSFHRSQQTTKDSMNCSLTTSVTGLRKRNIISGKSFGEGRGAIRRERIEEGGGLEEGSSIGRKMKTCRKRGEWKEFQVEETGVCMVEEREETK